MGELNNVVLYSLELVREMKNDLSCCGFNVADSKRLIKYIPRDIISVQDNRKSKILNFEKVRSYSLNNFD